MGVILEIKIIWGHRMKDIFNVKAMQKTPRELKHSVERYEEISVRNLAWTVYHIKYITITSYCIHQFRCFWDKLDYIFPLSASILKRIFAFYSHWKYLSFHGCIFFFIFDNCCIKSEIHIFMIPKLYLQLKHTIFIYW